jgi:outer membrane protein assembly factor BamA
MLRRIKYQFLLVCSLMQISSLNSQNQPELFVNDTSSVVVQQLQSSSVHTVFTIRDIIITGNKKTKPGIILREIPFKQGDQFSLQELVKRFEIAKQQLVNTYLFHEVVVSLKGFDGDKIDVAVDVSERWYIFPFPYLKPVDRNLNQWLFEEGGSLSRVNYGAKILHTNFTGHNDKFRLFLITGYTKQFSLNYDRPYFDKAMKWGIKISTSVGKNREVNYITLNNKQQFLKDQDNYLRNFFTAGFEISYRKAIRSKHRFGINYFSEKIKDTVVALNPVYFPAGRKSVQFPELYYTFQYFNLDYNPYPTRGYATELSIAKRGFDKINNVWQLSVKGSGNWPVNPKTFLNAKLFAAIKFPFKQPFSNQQLLGYNDVFIQGYEYYVVDGVAGSYLKTSITRELFKFNIGLPGNSLVENRKIPFRIFAKLFGNTGYVHNPEPGNNLLSNRLLSSAGVGIDILTVYDFIFKIEWTFNQLGQNGLFLHRRSTF